MADEDQEYVEPQESLRRPSTSLRSVSFVSGLTLAQLLLQFGTQLLQAEYFGAAGEMDAFVAAFTLPSVIAAIASGSLAYVLVPIVAEALARQSPSDAATVVRQMGSGLVALSLLATLLVAALAEPLTALLCPGFSPREKALTIELLRVLSLYIVAHCITGFLNALYHSYGHFTRPAVAGVIGVFVTLVYVPAFHQQQGIFAVAWGVVIGSAVTVAIMVPLFAAQFAHRTSWQLQVHPGTRRCLALLTPLVLGAVYWRLDPLLDRFLGSYLAPGSIAHMGYASRLVSGLTLIGTSGLSIVAFPAIAAHVAAGTKRELNAEIAHAFRFFLFLTIPICVGVGVFAVPVVRLLYEHGKFENADSQAVGLLIVLYGGVILGAGLGDLLSRTCYAQHDMRTPVIVSMAAFTLAALLKCLVVLPWGAAGIVAATSFYSVLNFVLLGGILLARLSAQMLAGTGGTSVRAVACSAVACLAAAVVMRLPTSLAVLPAAGIGALIYVFSMWMLRDEFAHQIQRWLVTLWRGRQV
jgi:putative peptidoglycan lipid II flippase